MTESTAPRREVRIRLGIWWRILLMMGMMCCTALAIQGLVRAVDVSWRGGYLTLLISLTPAEAYLSHRLGKRRELRGTDLTVFRLTEVVVLAFVLELMRLLWQGMPKTSWTLGQFLDLEFFAATALMLSYWGIASAMIRWFEELDYQPAEKPPPVTSPEYDLWVGSHTRHVQHTQAFRTVLAMILGGGVFILVVAGMARVEPRAIIDFQRGTIRALILHVLLYFVLGLALVAEARLSLLHARWQHDDVSISPVVARRWPLLVIALLALAAIVALLLPVEYSVGLIETLAYVVNMLITVFMTVVYIVLFLVSMIFYPFQWLLAQGGQGKRQAPPPPELRMPEQPAGASSSFPLLETLKSLLFWLVTLAIVAYAVYNYGREYSSTLANVPMLRPLLRIVKALAVFLQSLRRRARVVRQAIGQRLTARQRSIHRQPGSGRRFLRLGRLSPREMVQYYFLSTVRRASEAGFRRLPNQTPDEYSRHLRAHLPEVGQDVDTIASAFVEAKYSQHDIDKQYAGRLRSHWQRLKRELRRWRQHRREGE